MVMDEGSSLSKLRGCEEFVKHKLYVQNRRQNLFSLPLTFFLSSENSVVKASSVILSLI